MWYGVRAPYILDNGRGFYENLGTIGIVYTYSKGFEILTLPLSGLPSYSFLISFNLWLAAGILALAYSMARHFMSRELAVFLSAFLSAVPGIMNMTVTAKTDIEMCIRDRNRCSAILCGTGRRYYWKHH